MTRDLSLGFRVSDEFIAQNPAVDASATEVSINLFATAELAFSRMESVLAPFGLSRGGFNLLQVVAGADEALTPTQIGERILVRAATVTGLVDTLVRRDLVERRSDRDDRRRVLVSVTERGSEVIAAADAAIFDSDATIMACLTRQERERLIRLLGKLQNQLQELNNA
ncbi:MAG TPA: MarR family winged helix-turn-helix transcriptional regulator [Acidimicrobiales bacterium]|jgi:DNA-binding MarR family transcriptional regulator|nr:MarR family winged helix-turn-helix transcriptional regulator [Acidimicrobiales bacterium]